jgi:Protein of unknown function (DUF5131)
VNDTPSDRVADSPYPCGMRPSPTPSVPGQNDIAHARVSKAAVARIWAVMAQTPRHEYQVLSKRPKRLVKMLLDPGFVAAVAREATEIIGRMPSHLALWRLELGGERVAGDSGREGRWTAVETDEGTVCSPPWPLPNVWVGTSIELDEYCWGADILRTVPAAVRFLFAAKHARASQATVAVDADDKHLRLSVTDDGVGGADRGTCQHL